MSRETYVLRDGQLVPKHLAAPREGGAGPFVITDGMDPTMNPADGRTYDSRSQYVRAVKAAGCEIVGNDLMGHRSARNFDAGPVGPDIKRAIAELGSR